MLDILTDNFGEWSSGFWVTVRLVAISFVIAMTVGTVVAALRVAPSPWMQRAGGVYGIKGSFLFGSLREHPRFRALLRKMNLGDE